MQEKTRTGGGADGKTFEVVVGLGRDGLVTFEPALLNIFEHGPYGISFRLDPSVPPSVTFEAPYISFKEREREPFEVLGATDNGRRFELGGLNRERGLRPEPYPYQVHLGLGPYTVRSPDPSIIHHGTDTGPGDVVPTDAAGD
ncbi:MAG: hypothetical protein AAFY88_27300 [Acidobacteriota bacterium]